MKNLLRNMLLGVFLGCSTPQSSVDTCEEVCSPEMYLLEVHISSEDVTCVCGVEE